MHVVYETLRELGVEDRPVVTLFNKQDLLTGDSRQKDFRADYSIPVSAKTRQGLEELKKRSWRSSVGPDLCGAPV